MSDLRVRAKSTVGVPVESTGSSTSQILESNEEDQDAPTQRFPMDLGKYGGEWGVRVEEVDEAGAVQCLYVGSTGGERGERGKGRVDRIVGVTS